MSSTDIATISGPAGGGMGDATTGKMIAGHAPAKPLPMVAPAPIGQARTPPRVKGKLIVALKEIIERGARLDEAAKVAGLTTHAVRLALERPHVIRWMKERREVFRAFVCAKNISRLDKIADSSGNAMAQLGAIKVLEQLGDDPQTSQARVTQPGIVIMVGTAPVEAKPLIDLSSEPREGT